MSPDIDADSLAAFLAPQRRDYGGEYELGDGLWAMFVIPADDANSNALARDLLATAPFPYESGATEDDQHQLYYVTTENRHAAGHWLDDLSRTATGEVRPVALEDLHAIDEVLHSDKPHRAARQLADRHAAGTLPAGLIRRTENVRALLDRLHGREPLFYGALQLLLEHHLIDMLVLHRQLIGEDVALLNEIVKGGLSRDPFLQTRQDATGEIRRHLLAFRIINPMDQLKNATLGNPYAAYLEVAVSGSRVIAPVDGIKTELTAEDFFTPSVPSAATFTKTMRSEVLTRSRHG